VQEQLAIDTNNVLTGYKSTGNPDALNTILTAGGYNGIDFGSLCSKVAPMSFSTLMQKKPLPACVKAIKFTNASIEIGTMAFANKEIGDGNSFEEVEFDNSTSTKIEVSAF
jgi:hypothetical protein